MVNDGRHAEGARRPRITTRDFEPVREFVRTRRIVEGKAVEVPDVVRFLAERGNIVDVWHVRLLTSNRFSFPDLLRWPRPTWSGKII